MKRDNIREKIAKLAAEINTHNYNYYVLNNPIITDFEYDILMQDLNTLEGKYPEFALPNSPTKVVGSDLTAQYQVDTSNNNSSINNNPASSKQAKSKVQSSNKALNAFAQHPHAYPMLSLGNTYDINELNAFDDRVAKGSSSEYNYSCELKFDGTAICLIYKNGTLFRALTRGDGAVGDDVTLNVKQIKSIPHKLIEGSGYPEEFEIRGEIYMPYAAFDKLNYQRELDEEQPFANPRNAAAGSLKQLDSKVVKERGLACTLYHLIVYNQIKEIAPDSTNSNSIGQNSTSSNSIENNSIRDSNIRIFTQAEAMELAAKWGLPTSNLAEICSSIDEVRAYIAKWDRERKMLPFATDGIVIKVNQLDVQQQLGFTSKSPRWATAYKFKPEEALTKLNSVDFQVGRTGAITPVANLDPVQLSGTIVKRASLHNADIIAQIGVMIGDYVYVEKGGEIIPKITRVELVKRGFDAVEIEFPKVCPDCGSKLIRDEDEAKHFCPNADNCPMQIKGRFIHFVGRKAMGINAGEATIEQLYNRKYIKKLSDLYNITSEQLLSLEKWKEKSVSNFLKSLERSKSEPFNKVLFGLGIRHIGETTAKVLANKFKSINALAAATKEELLETDEVGEKLADSLLNYFANSEHIAMINELKEAGLSFEIYEAENLVISEALIGKTVVISGNFTIPRESLKKYIESHSGKVGSSISSKTALLVAGDKAGDSKLQKAEKLGILITTEQELYGMIENKEIKKII